ncbi:fimbrial biogenesis chaperone, partial [Burkholderia gladioli]|uniref:fimbrial biogenesis chaperone n=1 Tax=Burkholderia gladioli TaxID=28095 RepID=UPI0005B9BE2D
MKPRHIYKLATLIAYVTFLGQFAIADASVVIGGTRVIYGAGEPEVTIKLSNEGQSPALVQSWVDAGDTKSEPSTTKVPFVVTPPISRIDPSKSQTLRIVYTGEPLPKDRES